MPGRIWHAVMSAMSVFLQSQMSILWLFALQDFKQLYDMPNPYSPNAQSKPEGPRKSAGDDKQKQVRQQRLSHQPK